MNQLALTIQHLYPSAVFLRDFSVQDNSDGKGPFIARWDEATLGPQPDMATLEAAEPEAVAAMDAKRKRAEAVAAAKRYVDDNDALLESLRDDPSAPQEVKDYLSAK